ncbi:MAG: Ppx/GppA phosphatase family protein [Candidatus Eisenbacteria bacterium]|nr:Ppx/GppA phosphatase family protein [Candidatus Eisenbacteria bacterium]
MKIAAIDVGSNSLHLLIARILPDHSHEVIYKDKSMVRLGSRSFARGELTLSTQRRAFLALERFAEVIKRFEVDVVLGVATSAVREASNGTAFLREVRRRTGLKIDRISGSEEARLVAVAVASLPPFHQGQHLVVDIGGGSTELAFLDDEEPQFMESIRIGAIRLADAVVVKDRPGKKGLKQYMAAARDQMGAVHRRLRDQKFDAVAGTSGTIVCLGMLAARRAGRSIARGETFVVKKDELVRELASLASLSLEERSDYMGDQGPRADIIIPGGAILLAVLDGVKIDGVHIPDRSIRDGMILDYIRQRLEATPSDHLKGLARIAGTPSGDRYDPHMVRERNLVSFARRYQYEARHAHQVMRLAGRLFDETSEMHGLGTEEKFYLEAAALLHDIGQFIAYSQHHKHSLYLILNGNLAGFSEREVAVIGNVARYHRKGFPRVSHLEYSGLAPEDRRLVVRLAALLRVADALDHGHLSSVSRIRLERKRGKVTINLTANRDCQAEMDRAARKADLFEETYGCRVAFMARRRSGSKRSGAAAVA